MRNLKECAGDIVLLEDACHALGSSEILSPEKSIKTVRAIIAMLQLFRLMRSKQ